MKYKEHLALQQQQIPPLLVELSSLTAKLGASSHDGDEAANLVFQYTQALAKLSSDLTQVMETNTGLILNATSLLHQAIRKALLRNHRYTRLAWHSAAEIDAGSSYPTLVGVSSTGYPVDCKQWLPASHGTIADSCTAGPSRARPQEPFASLPVTHQAFPLHCESHMVTPTGLTLLTPGPCKPLQIEDSNRVYLVIYGWEAAS